MGTHQVRHDILVFAELFIHFLEFTAECVVYVHRGLAHFGQHIVRDVLRRYTQLAADMILAEFPQEGPVLVCQKIVEPEA